MSSWEQLDRRTVAVTALLAAGFAIGAAVPATLSMVDDRPPGPVLAFVAAGVLAVVGLAALGDRLRWQYTRYRITDERVELRFSLIVHRLRSVPRERIRTVDLTANPVLRMFGLVKVQIGTGQQAGADSQLVLTPVTRQLAERLRQDLLLRRAPAAGPAETPESVPAPAPAERPIAALDWSWIRYAPISVSTPILGAAAFGGVLQLSEWLGLQGTVIDRAGAQLRGLPVVVVIGILVAIGVVVGVIGSLGLFVELWWRYRLVREDGGMLRVRRGLLTTRSLSLEERRLRGVEVAEPLGARLVGAARVDAVASGLRTQGHNERSDPKTLLPPAPRELAHRVAAEVIGETVSPTESVRLRAHPPAARARRLRWAVGSVLLLAGVLALLGALLTEVLLHLAWISTVVLPPIAVALALDAYRNLGHGLTGDYLVTRYGTVSRHTVALRRSGIIGWTVTSSPFQRRAGLMTLGATTAANRGIYLIRDADEAEGLAFAEQAVPDLLTPFLERRAAP